MGEVWEWEKGRGEKEREDERRGERNRERKEKMLKVPDSLEITYYVLNWTFVYAFNIDSMIAFIHQGPLFSLHSDAFFLFQFSRKVSYNGLK